MPNLLKRSARKTLVVVSALLRLGVQHLEFQQRSDDRHHGLLCDRRCEVAANSIWDGSVIAGRLLDRVQMRRGVVLVWLVDSRRISAIDQCYSLQNTFNTNFKKNWFIWKLSYLLNQFLIIFFAKNKSLNQSYFLLKSTN